MQKWGVTIVAIVIAFCWSIAQEQKKSTKELIEELKKLEQFDQRIELLKKAFAIDLPKDKGEYDIKDEELNEVINVVKGQGSITTENKFTLIDVLTRSNKKNAWKPIVEYLEDKEEMPLRLVALVCLGTLKAKESAGEIAKLIKDDPDPLLAPLAIMALGQIGAKEYAKDIAGFLEEENETCISAIQSLGMLKAKEYAKDIVKLFESENINIRLAAIDAIGDIEASEYTKEIMKFLGESDSLIRRSAVVSLGKMKAKEALEQLKKLMTEDTDLLTRLKAKEAITQIESNEK
jgi:HEAT repeat protein